MDTRTTIQPSKSGRVSRSELAALILMGASLLAILAWHLLIALIAGLAAFTLYRGLVHWLGRRMPPPRARKVGLALLLLVLVGGIAAIVVGLGELSAASTGEGLPRLLRLFADTLEKTRASLPAWLAESLPDSVATLQEMTTEWLRAHASEVQLWGTHTVRAFAYVLAGLVIGFLASISSGKIDPPASPFARAWRERLAQLAQAFTDIVSAQLRIAALNTLFTAVYLLVALPMLGYHLPLARTLVAVTFFASLLPVVGNLISNTAIVLVSLTISAWLALVSLGFLIGVHKFEYFLNAHIVGSRIRVKAYELLAAMLLMEAAFGLGGVIAAPIYYAWLRRELSVRGVV